MGVLNDARISTFVAGFVLVMVTLVIIFNLVNSRTGRAIMAARDNRIAAESVGISVTKYKMVAFVVSAALAGAAGTLYGCSQTTFVATRFDFNTSILILVFVVLGGLGNMWGSVIAATALTILPEALRQFQDYRMLVYAIVLILVMLATNNPTMWSFITRVQKQIQEQSGKQYHVFPYSVPRRIAIAESSALGQSILSYKPRSDGAEVYQQLGREVDRNAQRETGKHRDTLSR